MTLAHKTHLLTKQRTGFTLMEIIVTLAIISTLIGGTIVMIANDGKDEITTITKDLQVLAKETLREAKLTERAQSIFITTEEIWAAPESDTSEDAAPTKGSSAIQIPEGVTVSYSYSGSNSWSTLKNNNAPFVWAFTQTGLCDAVSIKFESEDAVSEMSFHPLTAGELSDAY